MAASSTAAASGGPLRKLARAGDGGIEGRYAGNGMADGQSVLAGSVKVVCADDVQYVPPTARASAGQARLKARDSWNMNEIKIQELFNFYDRDQSGQLEQEEFRQLLRDFNDGRMPTEREFAFTLRLADTDHNGSIGINELHFALRTWYYYRHIDDAVLTLFAEFDLDDEGGLNLEELRGLLTQMNGGVSVPLHEVRYVMERSHTPGSTGAVNRSELLGAVAAWYTNVDREGTDMPRLLKEAVMRTAVESDHSAVLGDGASLWGDMAALLRGASGGYLQVNSAEGSSASRLASREQSVPADNISTDPLISGMGEDTAASSGRFVKAAPLVTKACGKFCYAGFPFMIGWVLATSGAHMSDNSCPRNLDGVLIWFGCLGILLGVLAHFPASNLCASRARIALVVLLVLLDLVGLAWTRSPEVQGAKSACRPLLVYWSMLVWYGIALAAGIYAVYHVGTHVHHLKSHDNQLQNDK